MSRSAIFNVVSLKKELSKKWNFCVLFYNHFIIMYEANSEISGICLVNPAQLKQIVVLAFNPPVTKCTV